MSGSVFIVVLVLFEGLNVNSEARPFLEPLQLKTFAFLGWSAGMYLEARREKETGRVKNGARESRLVVRATSSTEGIGEVRARSDRTFLCSRMC